MFSSAERCISDRTSVDRKVEVELFGYLPHSFERPPVGLALRTDEIHIWFSDLDETADEVNEYFQTLSAHERRKAGQFHFDKDMKRYIARHGILRMILGSYMGIKANELRFKQGENGKPRSDEQFGKRTVHFNLSHSNGAVLFAFARNHEIGVDIEHICGIVEMEQIVERFFSTAEQEVFKLLPEEQKREAFINVWTCKEAFIKARGDGLSYALDKFDVSMLPDAPVKLLRVNGDTREASRWCLQSLKPAPDYVGAFAVKSNLLELKCWRWGDDVNL
jgi:4'-phosphopantetheinyl transferase